MIGSFKRQQRSIIFVSICITIFLIIVFSPTLFNGKVFSWYNDHLFQHNYYYREWHRIINQCVENRNLGFFSWNTFLGSDFFTTKLLYCVGDFILTPVFILFRGEINYDIALCIETILCFVLSYINFVLLLDKFGIKSKAIITTSSLLYSFSGFVMMMSGTYMFHRFYALLPLYLFAIEQYRENGKLALFSIASALLFLQNYELFFSISLFTILYYIFTFRLHTSLSYLEIIKKSVQLIISYIVGIMMVGFALIPLLFFISNNTRVGTFDFGTVFWPFNVVAGFISNLFIPSINFRTNSPTYLFYSGSHFGSEYGIYSTPLFIIGLIHLFKRGKAEEKRIFSFCILITLFSLLIRPINMVIHGFSEPSLRFSFILTIINIIVTAFAFDKYRIDRRYTKEVTIVFISYILLLLVFSIVNKVSVIQEWASFALLVFGALTIFIFNYLMAKNLRLMNAIAIGLVTILYLISIYPGWRQYEDGHYLNTNELKYNMNKNGDILSRVYIKPKDLRPFNELNLNASMKYNYLTTTTYDSTFDYTTKPFLETNNYTNWIINIDKTDLLQMLGVKYLLVGNDREMIKSFDTLHIFNLDELEVYKINNSNSIGHTYSSFVNSLDKVSDWNNVLYIDESIDVSDIKKGKKQQLNVVEYNNQYMKASIKVPSKQVLMITIPYSSGWNIVDQNNKKLNQIKVQGGFLGLIIDENVSEIRMYYMTPGLRTGLLLSCGGLISFVILFMFDKRKRI